MVEAIRRTSLLPWFIGLPVMFTIDHLTVYMVFVLYYSGSRCSFIITVVLYTGTPMAKNKALAK
jgi:hypothetical protein